jgi:VanZ family protein
MICWSLSSVKIGRKWIYKIILAIGITSLYGASDEFHQFFTPNRSVEIFDWLADTAGAATAGFAWQMVTSKWQRKERLKIIETFK